MGYSVCLAHYTLRSKKLIFVLPGETVPISRISADLLDFNITSSYRKINAITKNNPAVGATR